ncbi:MAG: DUF3014 domain-containing protein [Gammaproteobacteria bacterium]|nr:DUF3014 domain-containing protein [Gammaproteobacteria bacterium]
MNKNLSFAVLMIFVSVCGVLIWDHYTTSFLPDELLKPIKTRNTPPASVEEEQPKAALFPVPKPNDVAKPDPVETKEADESTLSTDDIVEDEPLPELDQSDHPIRDMLGDFFPIFQLTELFSFENLIRHFTTTIDGAMGPKLPRKFSFANHPEGQFLVEESDTDKIYTVDERNYDRYPGFVHLIEDTEVSHIIYVYVQFYPLFQKAYEELGYPNSYFNDRLVEIIDHLLATPDIPEKIELIKPKVFYQFADPNLESLSASQKLLLRIGPKNAAKVRQKLDELRKALAHLK